MNVIRFGLAVDACERLISHFKSEPMPRRFDRTNDSGRTTFGIVELPLDHALGAEVAAAISAQLGVGVMHLRVHEWQADDKATEHVDNYYPGCDTVIVRLSEGPTSRLKIAGKLVSEARGHGYVLKEGTPHEILPGADVRYTLTGWVRGSVWL